MVSLNNPIARMGIIIAAIVISVFLALLLFLNAMNKQNEKVSEPAVAAATKEQADDSKKSTDEAKAAYGSISRRREGHDRCSYRAASCAICRDGYPVAEGRVQGLLADRSSD